MITFLLLLSIFLSTGRNLLTKNLSGALFGTREFFQRQSILFLSGALALLLFGNPSWRMPSRQTLLYAVIYAALLVLAQWLYTVALGGGNAALCATVYSMGFILPTLSGAVFWAEAFTAPDFLGVACAAAAIIFAGEAPEKEKRPESRWFLPLFVAMLASGGLGIMQKLQQKSGAADEKTIFLLIAFLLAAAFSFAWSRFVPGDKNASPGIKFFLAAAGVGAAFGSCNLLNTALAGMLPRAVFFPVLNIGVILLTMLCDIAIFRERMGRKELFVLIFGVLSILFLNIR